MTKEIKEVEFEVALKKLESIVQGLEDGELSLEEAMKQYEEGVHMADICSKRLTEAEKRVEILMKTGAGKFKTAPLEDSEENTERSKKKKII